MTDQNHSIQEPSDTFPTKSMLTNISSILGYAYSWVPSFSFYKNKKKLISALEEEGEIISEIDFFQLYSEKKPFDPIIGHDEIDAFRAEIPIMRLQDLNKQTPSLGNTILILSAKNGDIETIKILLQRKGLSVNQQNYAGITALHYAVAKNHFAVAKCLLEANSNANISDEEGNTALSIAEKRKNHQMISLIRSYPKSYLRSSLEYAFSCLPPAPVVLTFASPAKTPQDIELRPIKKTIELSV